MPRAHARDSGFSPSMRPQSLRSQTVILSSEVPEMLLESVRMARGIRQRLGARGLATGCRWTRGRQGRCSRKAQDLRTLWEGALLARS